MCDGRAAVTTLGSGMELRKAAALRMTTPSSDVDLRKAATLRLT
ncbi:hypothetical protein PR002_g28934 [Phytophthora rubi]|uniref:Uncharacterized protein n=1 Tax=Phytophthora rubi TaxID=129364 RepID=A0A6A3H605_9STRA|nr:hypothetical protein PR002_g28934 [Phytophthora rubi]